MNLKFTRFWVAVSVLITALFSVITTKATRLSLALVMFILLGLSSKTFAQTETLPAGSFIINMGVTPQTNSNGLKPYGMIYELMRDHDVSVKWVINPSKAKDGIDFTFNAVNYKGGTFIIPAQFITTAVRTRINYWISQGVVANLTTSALVVNVTHTLTSLPRWVLNDENTDIAKGFFTNAGITDANSYPVKTPSQLNSCDDIYVMPHSEPTWATHKNLFYWNLNSKGSIWAGCKTVSVMENLNGPDINNSAITRRLNFLMSDGPTPSQNAVPDGSHSDGTPPYTLQSPTHPFMQFMGVTDAAHTGGAEQIYLPNKLGSGWRTSTTIGSFDPTQSNVPTLSNGPAAAIAFGRGFGDNNRGWVLYEAGHDIGKDNNSENVAAQRAFFNFSFLAAQDKQSTITPVVNFPSTITAGQSYNVSVTASSSIGAGNFLYSWTSSCGGIFTNPTAASTSFTVPMITGNSTCIITLKVTDDCGRETLYTQSIVVNGGPPPAGVIGQFVWNDVNKNGIKDVGEAVLSGVTVKLYADADNNNIIDNATPLATTTTNASGIYTFTGLANGYYIVGVVAPTGFAEGLNSTIGEDPDTDVANDNNGVNTLANGEVTSNNIYIASGTEPSTDGDGTDGNLTLDFGLVDPTNFGVVTGSRCYESPTVPTIVNTTQQWRDNGNNTITFRTTLAKTFVDNTYGTSAIGWPSGHTFSNLTGSDKITIAFYDALGVKKLEFNQDYFTLNAAGSSGYKSFGVSGGDGSMVLGSASSVIDWQTSMDVNFNTFKYILTTNSPSTTTTYTPNSTYPKWIYDVWYEVTIDASVFGIAGFGYPLITGMHASPSKTGNNTEAVVVANCAALNVGNSVWVDANNNGIKDSGEQPVTGALVKLYLDANGNNIPDGAAIATTSTDGNGLYAFTNLAEGKYIVGVTIPTGFTNAITTATSSSADNNTDNDNNGVTVVSNELRSNFITLNFTAEPTTDGDGSNGNLTLDFGLKFTGSIGDFVWYDKNANGLQDANEPGIAGVTVTLNGPGGTKITTTDANGFYVFNSLATGTYTVTFSTPVGYVATPSNQATNDFLDSDPLIGVVSVNYTAGTSNYSVDAGFYKPLQLGNLVWNDTNKNGIFDNGEVGINNATVRLYNDANNDNIVDGAALQTVTTNASGNYLFSNVVPGNYIVGVVLPTGFSKTIVTATGSDPDNDVNNDNNGITVVAGEVRSNSIMLINGTEPTTDGDGSDGNLTLDFGIFNPSDFGPYDAVKCYQSTTKPDIVTATQYWRNNGDGTITIRSTLAKTFVDNTYGTSAIGWASGHTFSNLTGSDQLTLALYDAAGVKKLEFKQDYITASSAAPSGYKTLLVSGGDGGMLSGSAASILSGTTSMDVNFNDYGYVLITNSPTTTTSYAANVTYPNWIYDVWYEVTVSAAAFGTSGFGYPVITSTHASPSKTGNNTELVVAVPCDALSLGNLVWIDNDNDGVKDAGEPGVSGTLVKLYVDANGDNIADGSAIATTTTDANGNYLFTNLTANKYIVGVTIPSGYAQAITTATSSNPDNNTDNDNNGINLVSGELRSNFITLSTFAEPTTDGDASNGNLTLDFGIRFNGSIGDFVWEDNNGNGIQDAGEAGIAGVTVTLNGPGGTQITNTDANGFYSFSSLATGSYTVTFATPAGYVSSPSNQGSNDAVDSDPINGVASVSYVAGTNNNTIDAGFYKPVSIGNLVWFDKNNNGLKDTNEVGLVGLTVKLYVDANNDNIVDGAAIATTLTDQNGNYLFANLAPGNYIVGVTTVNGFTRGFLTATANDPDNDIDNDNNGINIVSGEVRSNNMLVTGSTEPTNDGDNSSGNLTLDFGLNNPGDFGDFSGTKCYENTLKPTIVNARQVWRTNADGSITIRTTLAKTFVDNTYGTGIIGWSSHKFSDLTGSDKLTMSLFDANGVKKIEFSQDYITASTNFPSGYGSLGVSGGDGGMVSGSASSIVSATSSMDVNFNNYGYVLITNSPTTDANYTPNSTYPNWIYDVWYEVTVSASTFGTAGFGYPLITGTHASPSKTGSNSETVVPVNCNTLNLGNLVWLDVNGNGVKDVTELGINGVTVRLYRDANGNNIPDGGAISTTVTSGGGFYNFTNLGAGNYIVGIMLPSGYANTITTASSSNPNNDTDNDNNGITTISGELRSNFITLSVNGEPTTDGDGNNGNLTLDIGIQNNSCLNTTETFPNQFNTGFSKPLTNSTFVGSTGTWTTTTSSNASIVVLTPYYSPSTSHAIKIVNWATNGSQGETPTPGVGTTSTTSPTAALTNICCPAELTLQYTLWTYTVNSLDNTTTFAWDFSNDNGVTWNQITSTTPAAIFSQYGANAKVNITIPIPLMYQNANFRYRIRSSKPIHNPYNFFVFIDDIKIASPTSCAPTLNLGNFVWNDINGDGDFDTFEPGVGAVTVRLYLDANGDNIADGAAIATTTTNAQGYYNFSSLPAGNYIVGIVIPSGYINSINTTTSSNPNNDINDDNNGIVFLGANVAGTEVRSNRVTLSVGGEPAIGVDGDGTNGNQTVDFGLCGLGGIGDFVWNDLNNNGIQNIGEPGLGGVNVTLTYPDGTQFTVPTANDGSYFFANLGPGTYTVTFATPSGFTASPSNVGGDDTKDSDPVAGTVSVTLTASQVNATIDAGFNSPITLGNLVWFDVNNNGIRDAGEPGIATATVNLYLDANNDNIADGAAIRTTTTDANGLYNFSSLTANNYIVGVVIPTGYSVVTTNGGDPDNNIDNDNNGITTVGSEIRSNSITLALGTEPTTDGDGNNGNLTLDFALKGSLNLGNLVWVDKCTYGIKDASEVGFNNATLNLYMDVNGDNLPDGAAIATTTTNASGIYGFSNLIAGNYIVGLVLPTKYANSATTANSATPNSDIDNDNHGVRTSGGILFSNFITLSIGGEPSTDGDGTNGNLTLDFAIAIDTDGDTIADIIDIDDDNDGITDVNESGGNDPLADCDNDCIPNYLDNVPGGSCTPWTDCNSDGINDFYDWDRDGIINSFDLDSDNDGILDVQEARPNCVNFASAINGMVTGTDADKNGLLSSADNGSGFANQTANGLQPQDLDKDGRPNFLDLDSDGDGITDATESRATYDTDGVVSGVDADGDGVRAESFGSILPTIADNFNGHGANGITLLDSDGDGKPNVYDIDSDNDGITDNVEGQSTCGYQVTTSNDCDADGVIDTYDLGGCASCLRTSGGITPFDKDGDGTPDYLDTDTDNDGAPDIYEGHSIPSPTGNVPPLNFWTAATGDADCDGLWDYFDQFNIGPATSNFANNVTHSNMGTGGNFDGPTPRGSIAQLPKSKTGSACDDGDRDWRDVSILPVTLLEFKGNLNNNAVKLTWSVSREVNIDSYEVERSFDGVSFTKIASIVATNNNSSSTSTYTSNDNLQAITAPNVYYRLSIIDKIGTVKNSNTINFKLNTKGKIGIVVNPNPAISFFYIKITTSKDAVAQIKVVDMLGRVLITQNGKIFAGTNTQTFTNINSLSAGTYLVQVTIDGEVYNEKLIVSK